MSSTASELGHRLMQAGAGAGKTTTLIATFFAFVKDFRSRRAGAFPRIVITTFTRKATQEVKERLQRRALELGDEETFRDLGQRSKVHISTIHGVLSIFLSRYGGRIGLAPDFKIAGADELRWLGRRELRRLVSGGAEALAFLEDHSFSELWAALEEWRETAGTHPNAAFASVDFFRARTLEKIQRLVAEARSLAMEIPNASKNAKWIEWAEVLKGLGETPRSDDEIEAFLDRLRTVDELGEAPRKDKRIIEEGVLERYRVLREECWDPLADPEKGRKYRPSYWAAHEKRCASFASLAMAYKQSVDSLLLERGLLSMADLERRSLDVIRTDPSAADAFSREWDYWMIDEYQDTSPVQVELLKALVGDRPHFVVGDPQQSIYSFRGARSEVFFEKKSEFEERSARVERVAANHRSRAPVLEFFNDFFAARAGFQPMEPRSRRAADGERAAAEFRVVDPIEGADAVALAVIEKIQRLLESGVAPESICVLARKNADLRSILDEARHRHVPVQLHTAGGFARRREVRDAAAFLRFLLNPADNLNFLTLLRSPWFFLPDEDLVRIGSSKPNSYWLESLRLFADQGTSHPVHRLRAWLDEGARRGLAGGLREFYRCEGLLDSAAFADPTGRREANLWKFLMQLEAAQRQPGFNGLAFAQNFERGLSTEDGNEDGDAAPAIEPKRVNLMTVHASKGLEFEHVIIANLQGLRQGERTELFQFEERTGRWTLAEKNLIGQKVGSILAQDIIDEKNERLAHESARLLYVAMTRAMESVTFVWERAKRQDPRAWTALVPFALTEGTHQTPKYAYVVDLRPPAPSDGDRASTVVAMPPAKWARLDAPKWAVWSATQLLESALLEDVGGRESGGGPQSAARGLQIAQRGTDAHRLFESLRYAPMEAVRALTTDPDLRAALDWIHASTEPPLGKIIENGHAEWGFAVRGEGFVLQGQIDLWGEVDGTVWLVDYKTGSTAHAEKALDQLAIYAWALWKMKRLRIDQPVRLVAVYPLEKRTRARAFARAEELREAWTRLLPRSTN